MQDKVVVITGASSGIGRALAELCVKLGAKGVVLAARREAELNALAEQLGPTALPVVMDVSKRADNERLRDATLAKFGQLDVWVANAGRGITRVASQLTDEDIDEMVDVNFKSVVYALQATLPTFKAAQRGHLIVVSSMMGRVSFTPIRSAYSAMKAAVNSLMMSARLEIRPQFPDVHLTTLLPGVVATDFGKNALHGGPDSRTLPMAQPVDEVAQVIADAIATPRAEIYTRPNVLEFIGRYYSAPDVGALEAAPPFVAKK